MRRSQQQRITAQHNPDGSTFTPRKPRALPKAKHLRNKVNRIRRQAMFIKLKTARFLKVENDAHSLTIGFMGRVGRLAYVHQYGKTDQVAPGGPRYRYPARVLLGLTQEEKNDSGEGRSVFFKLMAKVLITELNTTTTETEESMRRIRCDWLLFF